MEKQNDMSVSLDVQREKVEFAIRSILSSDFTLVYRDYF